MAKLNRIARLCFTAAVAIVLMMNICLCAWAEMPDFDRKCSITFTMAYNGKAIPGGSLKMYRIASYALKDYSYGYEWVPELADSGLSFTQAGTEEFARRISMLIESRSLSSVQKLIGKDGTVTFSNLDSGLYVVYQSEPATGYEPINAFCVSLPIEIDGVYVYDLQAQPKPRPEKTDPTSPTSPTSPEPTTNPETPTSPTKPDTPTTPSDTPPPYTTPPYTTPTPPHDEPVTQPYTTNVYEPEAPPIISMEDKLPQTGQLWWPTWMLGAFGAILLGLGILMRFLMRQSAEESDV